MKAKLANFYLAKGTGTPSYTFKLYYCTDEEIEAIKKNKGDYFRSEMEDVNGDIMEVPRVTLWDKHGCKKLGDYATDLIVTENGSVVNGDLETFELEGALRKSPAMQAAVGQAQAQRYLEIRGLVGGTKRPQLNQAPVQKEAVVNQNENPDPTTF